MLPSKSPFQSSGAQPLGAARDRLRRGAATGLIVGFAALLLATGCRTELNLEKGRFYACERDGGASFSSGPSDGGRLADGGRVAVVDRRKGDAGQCPGDWACGFEGYCHATDAGHAWLCAGDDDCTFPWRCGLVGEGGLGLCQDPGVAAPYPCSPGDDSSCEQGWRCGPAGKCVDPAGDELAVVALRPASAERLSPTTPRPVLAMAADVEEAGGELRLGGGVPRVRSLLWVGDGGATFSLLRDPVATADAGPAAVSWRGAGRPGPVGVTGAHAFFPGAGGYTEVSFSRDAGAFQVTEAARGDLFPGVAATAVRSTRLEDGRRELWGWDATHLAAWDVLAHEAAFSGAAPAGTTLLDVELLDGLGLPVVATSAGVVLGVRSAGGRVLTRDGGWATPLDALSLDPDAGLTGVTDLATSCGTFDTASTNGVHLCAIAALAPNGGSPQVTQVVVVGRAAGALGVALPSGSLASDVLAAPVTCDACPAGFPEAKLIATVLKTGQTRGSVVNLSTLVQCVDPQNSKVPPFLWAFEVSASGCNETTSLSSPVPVQPWLTTTGHEGLVWRVDGLGVSRETIVDEPLLAPLPATLPAAPFLAEGTGAQLRVIAVESHPGETGRGGGVLAPGTELNGYTLPSGGPGLVREFSRAEDFVSPMCGVPRLPGVIVAVDNPADGTGALRLRVAAPHHGGRGYAVLPDFPDLLAGPVNADSRLTDAGLVLVVSAFDTLTGDLLRTTDPGHLLPIRLVPLPRQPITSVALRPVEAVSRADLPGGVLIAQGRLFRFEAKSPQVWRSDELILDTDEAVEVWYDGLRPRTITRGGAIVGLDTRLALSAPLPDGVLLRSTARVLDQHFALTSDGLYHLVKDADAGPLGHWEKDTRLDGAFPEGSAWWKGEVLLAGNGNELQAFTGRGTSARLVLDATP